MVTDNHLETERSRSDGRRVPVYLIVLVLIFISTLITYIDRVNISFLLPYFHEQFKWNEAELGLLSSAFFVGYTIFQVPWGIVADKVGGKGTLTIGAAWWSGFTALSAVGTTVPLMMGIRALMGVGEAAAFPSDSQLIRQWVPQKQRTRATGWNLSAIVLGPLIASPVTVWILHSLGWQAVFLVYGAVGLAWTAVWVWYGRSKPEDHPKMTRKELERIREPEPAVEQEAVGKHPVKSGRVWGLTVSYFFLLYGFYLVLTMLPTYLVEARNFSSESLALTATIPYAVAFVTMNCCSVAIDRLVRRGWSAGVARRTFIYIGLTGTGVFTALEAIAPTAGLAVTGVAIAFGFTGLCFGPYWALPIDYCPGSPGLVSGMLNTAGNVAGIVAPAITGILVSSTGSWNVALMLSAALAVVGAVILAMFSGGVGSGSAVAG